MSTVITAISISSNMKAYVIKWQLQESIAFTGLQFTVMEQSLQKKLYA